MHDRINDTFILYFKIKLFSAFACKRLFRSFTGLYLTTHEFPKATLRLVCRSLSDKITITIFYNGADDIDYVLLTH